MGMLLAICTLGAMLPCARCVFSKETFPLARGTASAMQAIAAESGLLAWELKGLFVTQRHQTLIWEWPVAYHEISGRPQNWCLNLPFGHLPGGVRKKNQDGLYSVKVEVDSGGPCSSMPPEANGITHAPSSAGQNFRSHRHESTRA